MTTETTAFMIGYGFFLLITALLVFAWRREQMRNQELFKEKGDLIDENLKSLDIVKESLERVKQLAFERIDLRKQFIEQSELATEWRQKHDRLEIKLQEHMKLLRDRTEEYNGLKLMIYGLENELDRGNEIIEWFKDSLQKARKLNNDNEIAIIELLSKGKFPDEKGVYRKKHLSKNGENLPLGQYIDSLLFSKMRENGRDDFFRSKEILEKIHLDFLSDVDASFDKNKEDIFNLIVDTTKAENNNSFPENLKNWTSDLSQKIDNAGERLEENFNELFDFPNSTTKDEANAKETITLDDFLKSPDLATGHMKSVIEIKTNEPLHDFEKIADQATQPLADAIDWTVPQAFPKGYVIPKGVDVICVKENPWVIEGSTGKTKEDSGSPFIDWNGENYHKGNYGPWHWSLTSSYLAPINPTDHPLHPEFGKEKFSLDVTKKDIEIANPPAITVNDFKLP